MYLDNQVSYVFVSGEVQKLGSFHITWATEIPVQKCYTFSRILWLLTLFILTSETTDFYKAKYEMQQKRVAKIWASKQ